VREYGLKIIIKKKIKNQLVSLAITLKLLALWPTRPTNYILGAYNSATTINKKSIMAGLC